MLSSIQEFRTYYQKELFTQISIEGQPGKEKKILDHIFGQLGSVPGIKFCRDNKNFGLLSAIPGRTKSTKWTLLLSHADIVQPKCEEPSTIQLDIMKCFCGTGLDNRVFTSMFPVLLKHYEFQENIILLNTIREEDGYEGVRFFNKNAKEILSKVGIEAKDVTKVRACDTLSAIDPTGTVKFVKYFRDYKSWKTDKFDKKGKTGEEDISKMFGGVGKIPKIGYGPVGPLPMFQSWGSFGYPDGNPTEVVTIDQKKDLTMWNYTELAYFFNEKEYDSIFPGADTKDVGFYGIGVVNQHHPKSYCSENDCFLMAKHLVKELGGKKRVTSEPEVVGKKRKLSKEDLKANEELEASQKRRKLD